MAPILDSEPRALPPDMATSTPEDTSQLHQGYSRVSILGNRTDSASPPPAIFPNAMGRTRTSSGSPPVPVFPSSIGPHPRHRTSSSSPPPFAGALWTGHLGRAGREERPRFERDSLRNRSLEGRPGSRKHRRYTRSVDMMSSLRKAMAKLGEDANVSDAEALEMEVVWRPSAFYQLLELEGPTNALDVLEAAEVAAPRSRQPRQKDAARVAKENERQVRHHFAETLSFLQGNDAARDFIAKIENEFSQGFGQNRDSAQSAALLWMLHWDGLKLTTRFGTSPANEIAVAGLNPTFRKVGHQLARCLGLHSESRVVDGPGGIDENKVVTFRPPRTLNDKGSEGWKIPFSVAKIVSCL